MVHWKRASPVDSQVHGRRKMRSFKMEKRQFHSTPSQIFPTSKITAPGGVSSAIAPTGIISAGQPTAPYTTLTTAFQETTTLSNGQATLITTTREITVIDSSQYNSLLASESMQRATSTSTTSSTVATSSAAAKHQSNSNLGILIPAIVAPVAAVLIISFGLFWFFMRRRHHKEVEKQEFVMASTKEKAPSRGNSTNSGTSSTRELVRPEKIDKGPTTTSFEISRPSMDLFPPTVPTNEIGLARPMTPPDKIGKHSMPATKAPPLRPAQPAVPNFSGLRPGTAQTQSSTREQFGQSGPRSRSNSAPRGPPSRPPMGPPPGRNGLPPRPGPGQGPLPLANGPPSKVQDYRRSPPGSTRGPSPIVSAGMKPGNRAAPPKALEPLTPTGAFNGASPISQYSPIVKEAPTLGMVLAESNEKPRGPLPPTIRTTELEQSRADSPNEENVLSNENMRIARLANSSRLGFNSPTEKSPIWPSSTKMVSPELPSPLSRGELGPKPVASVLAQEPSSYSKPASRRPSNKSHTKRSRAHSQHQADRASVVSRVSTDDGYVDMDIDDKSDVSSLDEREKWQLETKLNAMGSSTHLPPSAQADPSNSASNPNYRDRDSEGPFVLSRY